MKPAYYITTAISYPNGPPHIGHAYEAIATDSLARFMRLDGHEVFFLTGTDEHGLKMEQTAKREGLSPLAVADRNSARFQEMAAFLGCSNDDFIRTSSARHHKAVQKIWRLLAAQGDIYKGAYKGWYSVRDEAFYTEAELGEDASGQRLSPQGTPVEWVEEESYFFRLSAYTQRLLAYYDAHPDFILPESRRNEVISFVRSGLQDLSISRTSLSWGIKVPQDEKHIVYVWLDALTNYLTAIGFADDEKTFARFWPAALHVIGKDIIRFHAVFWPAFLMSAGLACPKRIFAHGHLNVRGEKMSKSLGNVVDPFEMADQVGVDAFRYFFLREVVFGQDGNYSGEALLTRINADLANDLGNLAQRSLSMIARNCNAVLPEPGLFSPEDKSLLAMADSMQGKARAAMQNQALHSYLGEVWTVVAEANRYFAAQEPWALKKNDPLRMATVLYVTAETVRQIAILAQPVLVTGAGRLLDQLAVDKGARSFTSLGETGRLKPGVTLPPPQGVFPRLEVPRDAESQEEG
jgi:methionyl-tRNA synthetase